ncbi:MAG: hypothetical protein U0350_26540 [Caldilineaceae bacterium]
MQRQVMLTLAKIQAELGVATILIGHDMGLIAHLRYDWRAYAGNRNVPSTMCWLRLVTRTRALLIDSLPNLTPARSLSAFPGCRRLLTGLPVAAIPLSFALRVVGPRLQTCRWSTAAQVACHLYPTHIALPPMPAKAVLVGGACRAADDKHHHR